MPKEATNGLGLSLAKMALITSLVFAPQNLSIGNSREILPVLNCVYTGVTTHQATQTDLYNRPQNGCVYCVRVCVCVCVRLCS